jgi:hypothetical protein
MKHSDVRFLLTPVYDSITPTWSVRLTGGRIGYVHDYSKDAKHPDFSIQFNTDEAMPPGDRWAGKCKSIDAALSALEKVARDIYNVLALCDFNH